MDVKDRGAKTSEKVYEAASNERNNIVGEREKHRGERQGLSVVSMLVEVAVAQPHPEDWRKRRRD